MSQLIARSISAGYGKHRVLDDVSVAIRPGQITGIVGPNGCGKSTLLKSLLGLVRLHSGGVDLDGRPLPSWPRREVARRVAHLPQQPMVPPGLSTRELVALGRYPHRRRFHDDRHTERQIIDNALQHCDIQHLANRMVNTLSGGERQRAWIAMALAQDTPLVLLDEPITALDIRHQLQVMTLLRDLNIQRGLTICLVLHDINLALRYCDHLIAMRDGTIHVDSPTEGLQWDSMVREVFHVEATALTSADRGQLILDFSLPPDAANH